MTSGLFRVTLLAGVLALSGCALNVPQVDTARRLLPFGNSSQQNLTKYAWSLSMGGAEYTVYALRTAGRRVYFSNDYGMSVVWDGDSIIIAENFPGQFGRYNSGREINAQGQDERWYEQEGRPSYRAICTPQQLWRLSADRYGVRQNCTAEIDGVAVSSTHLLEVDAKQTIREIQASVFPGGPKFVLRRLSP
jgi:hypothetical protein